jgi:hypothetical protein
MAVINELASAYVKNVAIICEKKNGVAAEWLIELKLEYGSPSLYQCYRLMRKYINNKSAIKLMA